MEIHTSKGPSSIAMLVYRSVVMGNFRVTPPPLNSTPPRWNHALIEKNMIIISWIQYFWFQPIRYYLSIMSSSPNRWAWKILCNCRLDIQKHGKDPNQGILWAEGPKFIEVNSPCLLPIHILVAWLLNKTQLHFRNMNNMMYEWTITTKKPT